MLRYLPHISVLRGHGYISTTVPLRKYQLKNVLTSFLKVVLDAVFNSELITVLKW